MISSKLKFGTEKLLIKLVFLHFSRAYLYCAFLLLIHSFFDEDSKSENRFWCSAWVFDLIDFELDNFVWEPYCSAFEVPEARSHIFWGSRTSGVYSNPGGFGGSQLTPCNQSRLIDKKWAIYVQYNLRPYFFMGKLTATSKSNNSKTRAERRKWFQIWSSIEKMSPLRTRKAN